MNDVFIMDACALIAVLAGELGADVVRGVMDKAAAEGMIQSGSSIGIESEVWVRGA